MIDMKRARLIFRAREETIVTRELAVKLEEETPREIRRENLRNSIAGRTRVRAIEVAWSSLCARNNGAIEKSCAPLYISPCRDCVFRREAS